VLLSVRGLWWVSGAYSSFCGSGLQWGGKVCNGRKKMPSYLDEERRAKRDLGRFM